jgi:SnoaL-like domain
MDSQPAQATFNVEEFKQLYQTFDSEFTAQLGKLYSAAIVFKDPIHQLNGLSALTNYFAGFCNPATHCQFEFTNQILSDDQAFFQWQMNYSHPQLKNGQALTLNGSTLIKFNSHIIYHEDFYDMGAMIYQHLPIMGWAVKKINARIAGKTQ